MELSKRTVAPAASAADQAGEIINVFATDEQGTLAALKKAAELARLRRAQVVVLVPDVVEYGRPLDRNGHDPAALTASYRDLASRVGLEVYVRVCRCHDARHLSGRLLLRDATIVLGGRRGSWRSTGEQSLARELACEGHRVSFVDVDTGLTRDERAT